MTLKNMSLQISELSRDDINNIMKNLTQFTKILMKVNIN